MNLSNDQYRQILARKAIARRNPAGDTGVRSAEPQPTQGYALERPVSGKVKGRSRAPVRTEPPRRRRIIYTVYAVRPCDYDGYHIKELQDMLIKAGILDGDEWDILQGEVISEKAYSREEERTEVHIEPICSA